MTRRCCGLFASLLISACSGGAGDVFDAAPDVRIDGFVIDVGDLGSTSEDPATPPETTGDPAADPEPEAAPEAAPEVVPDAAPDPAADVPAETAAPTCGDGVCNGDETCTSCKADCGPCPPKCGDDACEPMKGETCSTCPGDCQPCSSCGNGTCDADETCKTCPLDCKPCAPACGDHQCNGTETCTDCPGDCGPCAASCPDGFCNGGETCASCAADCGACAPVCGDQACNGSESCTDCPGDCGDCPAACGNKTCDVGVEDCSSCPTDCGACPPVMSFNKDWTETLGGPIVAGRKLKIHYDWERLPTCRGTHNGCAAWTMTVLYTFDLAVPATETTVVMQNCQSQQFDPVIDIPGDAKNVWLWARNANAIEGCEAWDSAFGANYMFPVFTPAEVAVDISWAGHLGGNIDFQYLVEGGPLSRGDVDPAYFFMTMLGSELAIGINVEVYVPGITDRAYQNPAVAAQVANTAIQAQVRTNFAGGGGSSNPFVPVPLWFLRQADNNFVYQWFVGSYSYVMDTGPLPAALYKYVLWFRTPEGANAKVLGQTGANDQPRRFVYADNAAVGCPLFPSTPPADQCSSKK